MTDEARDGVMLDRVPAGQSSVVRAVDDEARDELAQHGIVPGVVLRSETRAPFGGPVVVRIGRARVAVGRAAARRVRVEPLACHEPQP